MFGLDASRTITATFPYHFPMYLTTNGENQHCETSQDGEACPHKNLGQRMVLLKVFPQQTREKNQMLDLFILGLLCGVLLLSTPWSSLSVISPFQGVFLDINIHSLTDLLHI